MKPNMPHKIWFNQVVDTGKTDRWGNPILSNESVYYPARVRKKTNVIEDSDRRLHNSNLEIDTVADAQVTSDMDINYVDADGNVGEGTIKDIEESVNFSGNRILFKVLMVDGF